jgi:hypothetical protein
MKAKTANGTAALFVACLLGVANAQGTEPKEADVCNAMCTASNKQCERDITKTNLSHGAALLSLAALGAKPTDGKYDPNFQALQQCIADHKQCAKDCAQPAPNSEATK